jgi:ferredoxin--NADP+ reductase
MRLDDYDIETKYTATVKETARITPEESEDEIRNIVLEVDGKDFKFDIGQSIGVLVPGPHEFGHGDHFRLYTVANTFEPANGTNPRIEVCVKRCFYIDDVSGEKYKGIASNFLCDRKPGDQFTITGPYGLAFDVPDDKNADILMIGLGTGIAPFRAFVKHIYKSLGGWAGKVRLFYGAKSGLEMIYMNDKQNDFVNYYDEDTFKAFAAVSPRPHMDDPIPLDKALEKHSKEVWEMVLKPDTHVYVAGIEKMLEPLNKAFSKMAGSEEKWERRKAELKAGGRWAELVY